MNVLSLKKEIKLENPMNIKSDNSNEKYQKLYDYLKKFVDHKDQIVLSIVLPVYNEERSINSLLCDLPNNRNIEIIVVDDHSIDNSVQEIQKVRENIDLKLYRHKVNRGYGGAIITGVKHSKGDVIVTMDSDGQHRPEDIMSLIIPVFEGEADYTIGSRYLGSNHYDLPLVTRLGEAVVEKFMQVFFNQKIMNNQNGFRAFNKKTVPLFYNTKYSGFTFATEIILRLILSNYEVKECPIKVYHRQFGASKINIRKLTFNLFSCLFRYYVRKIKAHLQ